MHQPLAVLIVPLLLQELLVLLLADFALCWFRLLLTYACEVALQPPQAYCSYWRCDSGRHHRCHDLLKNHMHLVAQAQMTSARSDLVHL